MKRKVLVLSSGILLCTCLVFILELNFVEYLKNEDKQVILPRGDTGVPEVIVSREKGLLGEDGGEVRSTPCLHEAKKTMGISMKDMYGMLKQRKQYELRAEKSTREMWFYIRKRLNKVDGKNRIEEYLNVTLKAIRANYEAMHSRYSDLNMVYTEFEPYQLNWIYWQRNISIELQSLMKKRLEHLQNPSDCSLAKKLVCRVAKSCGFGCQIHHVAFCFIMAYATKRTLILDSTNWRYSQQGWNKIFLPISSTCTKIPTDTLEFSMTSQATSVALPPIDSLHPRPVQLPMAIPKDIAERVMSFHGSPFAWFIAQFLKYLMRPSNELKSYIAEKKKKLHMKPKEFGPIVGLHVRRTDKKSEARYHTIDEYMIHVDEWYDQYETTNGHVTQRRIFIATDEPSVISDAQKRYPMYEILTDSTISSLANKVDTRYSTSSLFGLIFDVTMLSECDYIVCTFSSQVCRLAYELLQNHHVDGSQRYFSLDDIYYFGGQQAHDVVAIQDHKALQNSGHSEISFKRGDRLGIAGNEKNGYSVGVHRVSNIHGEYPSYKVEDYVQIEEFPSYEEVTS